MTTDTPVTADELDALLKEADGVLPEIPSLDFPEPKKNRNKKPTSFPSRQMSDYSRSQWEQLGDIDLEVRIELGRTTMKLEDVAMLRAGSVVVLDRYVDEPVNVLVNGKAIARGKLIVVDGKFSVQLMEFL